MSKLANHIALFCSHDNTVYLAQGGSRGMDQNARTWNLVQSELEDLKWHLIRINHYSMWGELILIPSKDWISFDPVLGLDQYTSSGIQYYHVNKIKQYGWLIYSWNINEFEI
jgi:coproporphyrinogen III oxidase-like Fe-S oxidoreductase